MNISYNCHIRINHKLPALFLGLSLLITSAQAARTLEWCENECKTCFDKSEENCKKSCIKYKEESEIVRKCIEGNLNKSNEVVQKSNKEENIGELKKKIIKGDKNSFQKLILDSYSPEEEVEVEAKKAILDLNEKLKKGEISITNENKAIMYQIQKMSEMIASEVSLKDMEKHIKGIEDEVRIITKDDDFKLTQEKFKKYYKDLSGFANNSEEELKSVIIYHLASDFAHRPMVNMKLEDYKGDKLLLCAGQKDPLLNPFAKTEDNQTWYTVDYNPANSPDYVADLTQEKSYEYLGAKNKKYSEILCENCALNVDDYIIPHASELLKKGGIFLSKLSPTILEVKGGYKSIYDRSLNEAKEEVLKNGFSEVIFYDSRKLSVNNLKKDDVKTIIKKVEEVKISLEDKSRVDTFLAIK